jgi:hypothetical protein
MHGPLNVKLWKIIYFYIAVNTQAQTLVFMAHNLYHTVELLQNNYII